MNKTINWIKENKLAAILLLIVAWFVFRPLLSSFFGINTTRMVSKTAPSADFLGLSGLQAEKAIGGIGIPSIPDQEVAPAPEVEDRLVIQESSVSLLVNNVRETSNKIVSYVEDQGGYMVDTRLTHPEEAAYGTVTVRVPSEKLQEALTFFRSVAVKATSEHLKGWDVTDEYVDIEARLETLNKTKVKFEDILEKATKVEDILRVQREIISLQDQIDRLKGRQQYLEKTVQMAKVTLHLSTDELALPYAPSDAWRPRVIFKMAVRSLIRTLRKAGSGLIWLVAYAVIWIPVLVIYLLIKRYQRQKSSS